MDYRGESKTKARNQEAQGPRETRSTTQNGVYEEIDGQEDV